MSAIKNLYHDTISPHDDPDPDANKEFYDGPLSECCGSPVDEDRCVECKKEHKWT